MSEMVRKETENVPAVERTRSTTTYTPRFDIVETEDELILYGDMPGVDPEDLEVRFENEHVIVDGRVAPRQEGHEHVYGEYGIGDFYREFRVKRGGGRQQDLRRS